MEREGAPRVPLTVREQSFLGLCWSLDICLLEGSLFSSWSFCLLLASGIVCGPFFCCGKCSGWNSPDNLASPYSCWLQTLTRLSPPSLDQ